MLVRRCEFPRCFKAVAGMDIKKEKIPGVDCKRIKGIWGIFLIL